MNASKRKWYKVKCTNFVVPFFVCECVLVSIYLDAIRFRFGVFDPFAVVVCFLVIRECDQRVRVDHLHQLYMAE